MTCHTWFAFSIENQRRRPRSHQEKEGAKQDSRHEMPETKEGANRKVRKGTTPCYSDLHMRLTEIKGKKGPFLENLILHF